MRVGILGTGQLGQMLAMAAHSLGIQPSCYGPTEGPASRVCSQSVVAPWDDENALIEFARSVDVVTYELEHLPLETVKLVDQHAPVHPHWAALRDTQDRLVEKQSLQALGVPVADFVGIDDTATSQNVTDAVGLPCLLKRRRHGYDGKGQRKLISANDFDGLLKELDGPSIAERIIPWKREASILAARNAQGEVAFYDVALNHHIDGILRWTTLPTPNLKPDDVATLQGYTRKLLDMYEYVGVLAVELFDTDKGWVVNEVAPRVHNSGHWSIEGAYTSQFENHIRAVCGLPLGATELRSPCTMVNLIGDAPPLELLAQLPNTSLHLYGKEPRPGRKIGHVTYVGQDEEEAEEIIDMVGGDLPA